MEYYPMQKPEKPWYIQKKESIESARALLEAYQVELRSVQRELARVDQSIDVLRALWIRQRLIIWNIKQETKHLNGLRGTKR